MCGGQSSRTNAAENRREKPRAKRRVEGTERIAVLTGRGLSGIVGGSEIEGCHGRREAKPGCHVVVGSPRSVFPEQGDTRPSFLRVTTAPRRQGHERNDGYADDPKEFVLDGNAAAIPLPEVVRRRWRKMRRVACCCVSSSSAISCFRCRVGSFDGRLSKVGTTASSQTDSNPPRFGRSEGAYRGTNEEISVPLCSSELCRPNVVLPDRTRSGASHC